MSEVDQGGGGYNDTLSSSHSSSSFSVSFPAAPTVQIQPSRVPMNCQVARVYRDLPLTRSLDLPSTVAGPLRFFPFFLSEPTPCNPVDGSERQRGGKQR